MTAEIAIRNKSAVAIAADSAVTISAGDSQLKIFDSADKLFELCDRTPIGIMLYNGMEYMGIPLATLVKDFRAKGNRFDTVDEAGRAFLEFLQGEGVSSPEAVKHQNLRSIVFPQIKFFADRVVGDLMSRIQTDIKTDDIGAFFRQSIGKSIKAASKVLEARQNAEFIGKNASGIRLDKKSKSVVEQITRQIIPSCDDEIVALVLNYITMILRKDVFSQGRTGIVVCGFGEKERFPSLVWFETDGMICGHLKYRVADYIDIDRQGRVAAVLPFAQKDMIERFLYGLDGEIEKGIKDFCRRSVPEISKSMLERIDFESEDAAERLSGEAKEAEAAFLRELDQSAFEKVRETSRAEIEDMVEFMPKPEMAKMAEALIDLTSIKRRVTRGMETVGGPVDVAVISRSEGFVWVKRKHYFPSELNGRFSERMRQKVNSAEQEEERRNGES